MSKKLDRRFPTLHWDWVQTRQDSPLRFDLERVRGIVNSPAGQAHFAAGKTFSAAQWLTSEGRPPAYCLAVEAMWRYERYAQQNYVLGPALQETFDNTSLKGVPSDAINLPYPSFYVCLENSDIELWGGPYTRWHKLSGFYLFQLPSGEIVLWMWGKPNSRSNGPGDDASAWMMFDIDEIYKEHEDIEAYIRWTYANGKPTNDAEWIAVPEDENAKSMEQTLRAARLAFNLLMYLQTKHLDAETETPETRQEKFNKQFGGKNTRKGKAKLAARDLARSGKHTVTYLDLTREAREKRAARGAGALRRVWVPGHWQRYWVGSGEDKHREWRLKEPFLRNRDASEGPERRYYVSPEDSP